MKLRRVPIVLAVSGATMAFAATPVLAHDCFNPTKDANAPTAGVHYTITGFDQNGPIFDQTGQGMGIGGFVAISPGVFPGQTQTLYAHTLGNSSNGHEEVGGLGSQKPSHACDGKGIDYIDDCLGA